MPEETIGQRVKRLREEKGLSQRDIASPRCSFAYISRIEAGARKPSVAALRLLAGKLGVAAFYLEHGYQEMVTIVGVDKLTGPEILAVLHDDHDADELADFLGSHGHNVWQQRSPVDDQDVLADIRAKFALSEQNGA